MNPHWYNAHMSTELNSSLEKEVKSKDDRELYVF